MTHLASQHPAWKHADEDKITIRNVKFLSKISFTFFNIYIYINFSNGSSHYLSWDSTSAEAF